MSSVDEWLGTASREMSTRNHVATVDVKVAREHIRKISGGDCLFSVRQPNRFEGFDGSHARLERTTIQFLKWESRSECQTSICRAPGRHIVFHFPVSGEFEAIQNGKRARAKAGQMMVVGTEGNVVRRWDGPCALLNVMVARDTLVRILATEFSVDVTKPLEFSRLGVIDLEQAATLARYLAMIVSDLTDSSALFGDPLIGAHAERTFLMLLLKSVPNSYLETLNEPASNVVPFYIRRAEQCMRERMGADITIDDLSAAAGVSARTLYYGFKNCRGMSPMRYLKRLRLSRARNALIESRLTGTKIGEIAAQVGYRQASQFAKDYKERFGESPATTKRGGAAPIAR